MVSVITAIENNRDDSISTLIALNESKKQAFEDVAKEITESNSVKWAERYTARLNKITEAYNRKIIESPTGAIQRLYLIIESKTVIAGQLYSKMMNVISSINNTILHLISSGLEYTKIVAKIITLPGSWILFYFIKKWHFRPRTPLLAEGVHFILATMGGGKSSIVFDIIEELRLKTGYGSSINTALENPKFNKVTNSWFTYHDHFDMFDKFGFETIETKHETRVIATLREQFDPNFLAALVFDEFQSALPRRQNKSADYNKVFLAIFNLVIHKRHINKDLLKQGIKRIYFMQQTDAVDGLLEGATDYKHLIQVDLDCSFWEWVKTDFLSLHIRGWEVWTYRPHQQRTATGGEVKFRLYKHYYRKKSFNDDDFESRNQGEFYDRLPKQKTKYNKLIDNPGGKIWI